MSWASAAAVLWAAVSPAYAQGSPPGTEAVYAFLTAPQGERSFLTEEAAVRTREPLSLLKLVVALRLAERPEQAGALARFLGDPGREDWLRAGLKDWTRAAGAGRPGPLGRGRDPLRWVDVFLQAAADHAARFGSPHAYRVDWRSGALEPRFSRQTLRRVERLLLEPAF